MTPSAEVLLWRACESFVGKMKLSIIKNCEGSKSYLLVCEQMNLPQFCGCWQRTWVSGSEIKIALSPQRSSKSLRADLALQACKVSWGDAEAQVTTSKPRTLWLGVTKVKWKVLVTQSCLTRQPHEQSPPDSSDHGILQARVLEWIAISFSKGSSSPMDQTKVSRVAGRFFMVWATGAELYYHMQ